MREEKERFLVRARRKVDADPRVAIELGVILLTGMEELVQLEAFAGRDLNHTYKTHFEVPGDGEFFLTIARRENADAR